MSGLIMSFYYPFNVCGICCGNSSSLFTPVISDMCYLLINLAKGLFGFMMLSMKYLFTLFIVFIICFFSPLLISALCCFFTEGGSLG